MKNSIYLFFLFLLMLTNCSTNVNEIGANSIVYYENGKKVIPKCSDLRFHLEQNSDNLVINICYDRDSYINYTINNFQGNTTYYFDSLSENLCKLAYESFTPDDDQVYYATDNHHTYLRILEFDSSNKIIRGIFEAELRAEAYPDLSIRVTKGRFDYYY